MSIYLWMFFLLHMADLGVFATPFFFSPLHYFHSLQIRDLQHSLYALEYFCTKLYFRFANWEKLDSLSELYNTTPMSCWLGPISKPRTILRSQLLIFWKLHWFTLDDSSTSITISILPRMQPEQMNNTLLLFLEMYHEKESLANFIKIRVEWWNCKNVKPLLGKIL